MRTADANTAQTNAAQTNAAQTNAAQSAIELEAAFESIPLLDVGESARLHIRARNDGEDTQSAARVLVRCDAALLLVSTVPWLRGDPCGRELSFLLPPLLRDETLAFEIDVFAAQCGDARVVVSMECDGSARECELRCACEGRPAFVPSQNRVEQHADEGDAGTEIAGRAIVTNTGSAAGRAELRVESDLDGLRIDGDAILELEPGERRILGFTGSIAAAHRDGSRLRTRAFLTGEHGEVALGERFVVVRSRPRLEGTLVGTATAPVLCGDRVVWRLSLRNAGRAEARAVTIALRAAGGVYLAGSTEFQVGAAVEGRIVDVAGTSPLWSTGGLCIERLGPDGTLTLACATIVDRAASASVLFARVAFDGGELVLESTPVAVDGEPALASLPFTVRDVLVRGPGIAPGGPGSAFGGWNGFSRSASCALGPMTVRQLDALGGFLRHLWALSVLCGDACDDAGSSEHLAAIRATLRSVFDRLSIKVRIPQYELRPDDVLDPPALHALSACVHIGGSLRERLAAAATLIAPERDARPSPEVALYRDALRARILAFEDDAALIAAFSVTEPELDRRLDDVVAHESLVLTA